MSEKRVPKEIKSLTMPQNMQQTLEAITYANIDPEGTYYGHTKETAMKIIQNKFQDGKTNKVAAIFNDDLNYDKKDYVYDEYLEAFVLGCDGKLSTWDLEKDTSVPLVIRGVGKASRSAVTHCWNVGRDFYAIDTGYFGNLKSKSKGWHRVTKNNLQNLGPIIERPTDRLLGWKYRKFKPGKKILICPPSEKVMKFFDQPSSEEWTKQIVAQLKDITDRPIQVRLKPNRTHRITGNSIEEALEKDIHCLITYNSIAALEALNFGKPAIALDVSSVLATKPFNASAALTAC